jgi:hypothetical protein
MSIARLSTRRGDAPPTAVPHGRARIVLRTLAVAVLLAAALTGCASPGGGASTRNDANRCAAVLPLANDVVHGQGTLTLVRPVDRADIEAITRQVGVVASRRPGASSSPRAPAPSVKPPPGPKACLVVYRGNYPAGLIADAQPAGASGQYALVVLWVRHPAVERVLITNAVPASAHRHWWHF